MVIFDRHVGLFYIKRIVKGIGKLLPIKINKKGMADCYGLITTKYGLIHIEIEFKSGAAIQTKEQKEWEKFTRCKKGSYFLVRK